MDTFQYRLGDPATSTPPRLFFDSSGPSPPSSVVESPLKPHPRAIRRRGHA